MAKRGNKANLKAAYFEAERAFLAFCEKHPTTYDLAQMMTVAWARLMAA